MHKLNSHQEPVNNRRKSQYLSICSQSHYAEVYCTDDDSTGADSTGDDSTGADPTCEDSTGID